MAEPTPRRSGYSRAHGLSQPRYSEPQTTSADDARTSTLSFWPSVYLRQVGSETSQVPWPVKDRVRVSVRLPWRRAPRVAGTLAEGTLASAGQAGVRPTPEDLSSVTGRLRRAVNRHQLSITGSERNLGLHFLTCSKVPSFLS